MLATCMLAAMNPAVSAAQRRADTAQAGDTVILDMSDGKRTFVKLKEG